MAKKRKTQTRHRAARSHHDDDDEDEDEESTMPEAEHYDEPANQAAPEQQTLSTANAASVRACSSAFTSAIPPAARTSGVYDYAAAKAMEDEGVQSGLLPTPPMPDVTEVPDGRYRVDGQDWIVTIAGGVPTLFERATPQTDPALHTAVPTALP